jgi:hypothetical protein
MNAFPRWRSGDEPGPLTGTVAAAAGAVVGLAVAVVRAVDRHVGLRAGQAALAAKENLFGKSGAALATAAPPVPF